MREPNPEPVTDPHPAIPVEAIDLHAVRVYLKGAVPLTVKRNQKKLKAFFDHLTIPQALPPLQSPFHFGYSRAVSRGWARWERRLVVPKSAGQVLEGRRV